MPPVAASVAENGEPTCPLGSEEVVMAIEPAAAMVRVRFALFVNAGLLESMTLNVSGALATAEVGVPVIVPEEVRVRPSGSVPFVSDQV